LLHAHARRESYHVGESIGVTGVCVGLVDYGSRFGYVLGKLRRTGCSDHHLLAHSGDLKGDLTLLDRAGAEVDVFGEKQRKAGSRGAEQIVAFRQAFEVIAARGVTRRGAAGGARA
jgi:hypothetical protein